jgi:diguanylate cyclase (GGDEF)-like protein
MTPNDTAGKPLHRERRALHAVLMTFIVLFLISAAVTRYDQRQMQGRWVSLYSQISARITRTDGSTSSVKGTQFGVLNRGDRLDITVRLPARRQLPNAALCFDMTNAAVSVYSGSQLLTFYGDAQDAAGRQIGDVYYRVPLPDSAWGSSVHISCRITENNTACRLTRPAALGQIDSIRYFFFRYSFNPLFFVAMFVVFFVCFFLLLFYPTRHPARQQGVWLSLFSMLLSLWFLAGNGFLFTIMDNIPVCANTEYAALFAMPVAFGMFLRAMSALPGDRRYLSVGSGYFLALFLAATVLNFTTRRFHYHALLPVLHLSILAALIPIFIRLFRLMHTEEHSQRISRSMLIIAGVVSVLELARYALAPRLGGEEVLRSVSAFGIIILSGTFLVGYLARLSQLYEEERNQEFLQRMAFVDILTGLPNRACCQEELEKLGRGSARAYTLIFFDVNRLKFANDSFGHEMGDRLLRYVAASLQATFWAQRVCGRWGGDEFLVCLADGQQTRSASLLEKFQEEIQHANDRHAFPFEVSVAFGSAESTEECPLPWDDAVKLADRRMYERKRETHIAR